MEDSVHTERSHPSIQVPTIVPRNFEMTGVSAFMTCSNTYLSLAILHSGDNTVGFAEPTVGNQVDHYYEAPSFYASADYRTPQLRDDGCVCIHDLLEHLLIIGYFIVVITQLDSRHRLLETKLTTTMKPHPSIQVPTIVSRNFEMIGVSASMTWSNTCLLLAILHSGDNPVGFAVPTVGDQVDPYYEAPSFYTSADYRIPQLRDDRCVRIHDLVEHLLIIGYFA